jgi:superoxide dismutase, Cu-Zn family
LAVLAVFSCKETKKDNMNTTDTMEEQVEDVQTEIALETVSFIMQPKSDSNVKGDVSFTEQNGTVTMKAEFSGLSEGEHAVHLHEKADCSAADGTSTGGHWNPTNEPHGKWGDETGYHKGDIGNLTADTEGNATVAFSTDQWCLNCGDETKNILGKAVIVHQGIDDFTSQPSGAAGARVSCTGIIQ